METKNLFFSLQQLSHWLQSLLTQTRGTWIFDEKKTFKNKQQTAKTLMPTQAYCRIYSILYICVFVLFLLIDNNILRLKLPLKKLYRINNESSNTDDTSKNTNIDEEAFPQTDVEFTNISVISEEMKKG